MFARCVFTANCIISVRGKNATQNIFPLFFFREIRETCVNKYKQIVQVYFCYFSLCFNIISSSVQILRHSYICLFLFQPFEIRARDAAQEGRPPGDAAQRSGQQQQQQQQRGQPQPGQQHLHPGHS